MQDYLVKLIYLCKNVYRDVTLTDVEGEGEEKESILRGKSEALGGKGCEGGGEDGMRGGEDGI